MEQCKFCKSIFLRKEGIVRGVQRYKCKKCGKFQIEGDLRLKYSEKEKNAALTLYLEGCGFRRIARILTKIYDKKFVYQTVIQWIKNFAKTIESHKNSNDKIMGNVEITEMDELYTFIKKKKMKQEYGLLLTETGCVLLHLKLEKAQTKL